MAARVSGANPASRANPRDPETWKSEAKKHLGLEPDAIRLHGLYDWKFGTAKSNQNPSGSKLGFENFLHFRALVKKHPRSDFELESHVSPERASAANGILRDWDGFENYMSTVPNAGPRPGCQ